MTTTATATAAAAAAAAEAAAAEAEARNLRSLESLMEVGHSALHKLGRLEQEWDTILPILIKRIVAQYSDLRQYKKESLGRLERMESLSKA